MADVVSAEKRSAMMAGIRGKDTKPEMLVRKALFAAGYRFRLHRKDLPGRPDVVMPGRRIAIFVHGCFWHGHEGCRYAKVPATRTDFWMAKLASNRRRDARDLAALHDLGWRTLVVWECFLRSTRDRSEVAFALDRWIKGVGAVGALREPDSPAKGKSGPDRTTTDTRSSIE